MPWGRCATDIGKVINCGITVTNCGRSLHPRHCHGGSSPWRNYRYIYCGCSVTILPTKPFYAGEQCSPLRCCQKCRLWLHHCLPCAKGGGLSKAKAGGIVCYGLLRKNDPSVTFGDSSLYTREPLRGCSKGKNNDKTTLMAAGCPAGAGAVEYAGLSRDVRLEIGRASCRERV